MSLLVIGLSGFSSIWLLVVLLALAGAALECERWWTRARRQRGATPGAAAYALDGLVIVSLLASLGLGVALLLQGLLALLALVGNLFGWAGQQASANPALLIGLLVICVAAIAGVVFVRRRASIASLGQSRDWSPDMSVTLPIVGGASAIAQSPSGMISAPPPAPLAANHNVADHANIAQASSAPVPARPVERPAESQAQQAPTAAEALADEHVPAFAMLQQRRHYVAAPQPKSFLELAEAQPQASDTPKRRRSFAPALATLIVVGALACGAVLFRQQIGVFVSGMRAAPAGVATSVASVPTHALASANVAAAIASPAPATETRRVKNDQLNVRVSPGTDQDILVVLAKGDAVMLLNETREIQGEDWVKVRVGTREGWVNQKLLE